MNTNMVSRLTPVCALVDLSHTGNRNCPQEGQPHPLTGEISPVTLGHEFCGRVEECDAGCGLRKGQGVVVDPRLFCNSCIPCRSSSTNSCNSFGFLGLSGAGGGLSDFVAVNQENVYGLPDDSPLRLAALVEPLAVAWRAVSSTGWEGLGDVPVLIVGGGPIGLAVAVVIKARGGKRILVSEPAKARRERAALHAEAVFNPLVDDVPKAVRILTNNQGVGIVFDCAGMQPGMDAGMQSLSLHGTYMCVAGWSRPVCYHVHTNSLDTNSNTVGASAGHNNEERNQTPSLDVLHGKRLR